MWFIDGASYVDTDDSQWDYYIIFEKFKNDENNEQYAVAGFSTVFRFYAFPEMIRPRIRYAHIISIQIFQNNHFVHPAKCWYSHRFNKWGWQQTC